MEKSSIILKSLDVVTLEGYWYDPIDLVIRWASKSKDTHCVMIREPNGRIFDPTVGGILDSHLMEYKDRTCNVLRYKHEFDFNLLMKWALKKQNTSKGYDYIAWLGFAFAWKKLQDPDKWYCSEYPYWMFQGNGYRLTNTDLVFVYPSELTNNTNFDLIYHGKVKDLFEGRELHEKGLIYSNGYVSSDYRIHVPCSSR